MPAAARKAEALSARFELDEQFLASPDTAALKSALSRPAPTASSTRADSS